MRNNVGVNGQGGTFNCNREGNYIMVICEDFCTPRLAISTFRAWKNDILSAENSRVFVPVKEGDTYAVESPHTEADFQTLVESGGFWGGTGLSTGYALQINEVTERFYMTLSVALEKPAYISQVYV